MHHVQDSSDQQVLTDEQSRAEIGNHVTLQTLPDMTKGLLCRKMRDSLCLQQGYLDCATERAHARARALLGFCKNTSIP